MKAVLSPKAGPAELLQLTDMPQPTPGAGEIRVKVHCATVTSGDAKLRRFNRLMLTVVGAIAGFKPMKIPGIEYSGVVDAVGPGVSEYIPGDQVRGTTTGLAHGANAEFVCVPVKSRMAVLIKKSEKISHQDAAVATVGPMTALQLLNKAGLKKGETLLVYGASGSVGTAAVQLARHLGAEVSAVCSGANSDLVNSLGAEEVIDYTREDFTKNGNTYDVIFDAVGKLSKSKVRNSLSPGGRFTGVKSITSEVAEELEYIQSLQAEGSYKSVIDREFSLDEIVQAHQYVDSGRKRGNVVINIVAV